MRQDKRKLNKFIIALVACLIIVTLFFVINTINQNKNSEQIAKKIYFNKPVSWEEAYAYLCDDKGNEIFGEWPGIELTKQQDYIYFFEITNQIKNGINKCKVTFNNGAEYKVTENCIGYNQIYNLTSGIGEDYVETTGEWIEYKEDIKIGKIPTTQSKIKNVIYMVGDGMGENHIIAGGLYKGEELNIQKIENKSYVKTASLSTVTDSAAGATALATGNKTINGMIGKDQSGNDVENLIEYANSKKMKTGIVCTQILNHATPAGFSVHNVYRYNYEEIAQSQIECCVDLMLGGGRKYFRDYEFKMVENNCKWINELSELKNINENERVIGTFAEENLSLEINRTSLADMTKGAIDRLEDENGFFLMLEGSDIDTYSHSGNMDKMLIEMLDFDDAVGIAMDYVKSHPDTLLIVTADHETGGLNLDGVTSKEQLTDLLFTSYGQHTQANVVIYAYGLGASDITKYDIIDNTSIYRFVRKGLDNNYKK